MRETFGSDRGFFSVESELNPQKTKQNQANETTNETTEKQRPMT